MKKTETDYSVTYFIPVTQGQLKKIPLTDNSSDELFVTFGAQVDVNEVCSTIGIQEEDGTCCIDYPRFVAGSKERNAADDIHRNLRIIVRTLCPEYDDLVENALNSFEMPKYEILEEEGEEEEEEE